MIMHAAKIRRALSSFHRARAQLKEDSSSSSKQRVASLPLCKFVCEKGCGHEFVEEAFLSATANSAASFVTEIVLEEAAISQVPCIADFRLLRVLNVGGNMLGFEPIQIMLLHCPPSVTNLDVSANNIRRMPKAISNLCNLEVFNAANNVLSEVGMDALCTNCSPTVRRLDVSYNKLEIFPVSISRLVNLSQVNIVGNKMVSEGVETVWKRVPPALEELIAQRVIIVGTIQSPMERLVNLLRMDLSHCVYLDPGSVFAHAPTSLVEMKLYSCGFRYLSRDLRRFPSLKTLDLAGNDLSDEAMATLCKHCPPSVEVLILRGNKIGSIPSSLQRLIRITKFDISANHGFGDECMDSLCEYLSPEVTDLAVQGNSKVSALPITFLRFDKLREFRSSLADCRSVQQAQQWILRYHGQNVWKIFKERQLALPLAGMKRRIGLMEEEEGA